MTEYQIVNIIRQMSMYASASRLIKTPEKQIVESIVTGFTGQLKGWWDFHMSDQAKYSIYMAKKPMKLEDGTEYSQEDIVSTLLYTIGLHFVGSNSQQMDRSRELLINLKCPTLSHYRWYKMYSSQNCLAEKIVPLILIFRKRNSSQDYPLCLLKGLKID